MESDKTQASPEAGKKTDFVPDPSLRLSDLSASHFSAWSEEQQEVEDAASGFDRATFDPLSSSVSNSKSN